MVRRLTIAYLLRQNYKKKESHLMKSEKWYAARREEKTRALTNHYQLCDNHLGIPVFEISLSYPSKFRIPAFWVSP